MKTLITAKHVNSKNEFMKTLRGRINDYFKKENKSVYGNSGMVTKTIVMLSLYIVPLVLMLVFQPSSILIGFGLWTIMAFGMLGIGLSIMHDALHGAYSKNKTWNNILGYCMNLVGGSATNWKIQHNVLHHSFTNVDGLDEDIESGNLFRFSDSQEKKWYHKFQHLYALPLYSFMTLSWSLNKDYVQLARYQKNKLTGASKGKYAWLWTELTLSKAIYFSVFLVLPMVLLPYAWWVTLIMFLSMRLFVGLAVACIFQLAHVMPDAEFPLPNTDGELESNWAIHQLITTCNFGPKSRIMSWFIGGLNHQIEHHLFPNICHVHYKKISKIVRETAKEYNLPYNEEKTFFSALFSHMKHLKLMGSKA